MRNRILAYLIIAALGFTVFAFFFIRTQPIPLPQSMINPSSSGQQSPSTTFIDQVRGAKNARVTIVEYGDFECGACKQAIPIIDIAMKTYPNDVRFVWKDMPNDSVHPHATSAAVAARCAANQGKFWEYANMLFDRQTYLSEIQYKQIADAIQLNRTTFDQCIENQTPLAIVKKNLQEGLDLGIVATPTIFVGNTPFVGVPTTEDVIQAIEAQLGKAN